MDLNFFILGGYGQFIWPAFIFTFISCLILYLKTKKELKKQEKIFFSAYKELKTKCGPDRGHSGGRGADAQPDQHTGIGHGPPRPCRCCAGTGKTAWCRDRNHRRG